MVNIFRIRWWVSCVISLQADVRFTHPKTPQDAAHFVMSDQRIHTATSSEHPARGVHASSNGAIHPQGRGPRRFRLLYNQAKGFYRLQCAWEDETAATVPGYTTLEEYGSCAELKQTLRHWPRLLSFIVYEARPRDVVVAPLKDLPDDWLNAARYEPFVLFNDEAEARRYAEQRRDTRPRRRTAA